MTSNSRTENAWTDCDFIAACVAIFDFFVVNILKYIEILRSIHLLWRTKKQLKNSGKLVFFYLFLLFFYIYIQNAKRLFSQTIMYVYLIMTHIFSQKFCQCCTGRPEIFGVYCYGRKTLKTFWAYPSFCKVDIEPCGRIIKPGCVLEDSVMDLSKRTLFNLLRWCVLSCALKFNYLVILIHYSNED